MLQNIGSIAGEDDARRVAAAVANAEGAEWCFEEADVGAGDSLSD